MRSENMIVTITTDHGRARFLALIEQAKESIAKRGPSPVGEEMKAVGFHFALGQLQSLAYYNNRYRPWAVTRKLLGDGP